MGRKIPHDCQVLESSVAGGYSFPEIPHGDPQSHLHDERDRVGELLEPKDYPEPSVLPDYRFSGQTRFHGLAEHIEKVDYAFTGLGCGPQSIRYHLRR